MSLDASPSEPTARKCWALFLGRLIPRAPPVLLLVPIGEPDAVRASAGSDPQCRSQSDHA